jgi:3-dehydroquinate synthase
LLAGYAEVAKYGALGDADFFEWLEQNGPLALAGAQRAMVHAVAHSCQMKADIVARDERESGERALLNLGHTFGHALEALTGFSAGCCMAKASPSAWRWPSAFRCGWG